MRWAYVEAGSFVRLVRLDGAIPMPTGALRRIRSALRSEAEADDADALEYIRTKFGVYPVVDNARPADTPTTTWDRSWVVGATDVTETWTERAKTQDELDAEQGRVDQADRKTRLDDILAAIDNRANDIQTVRSSLDAYIDFWETGPGSAPITNLAGALAFANEMRDQWTVFLHFLHDDDQLLDTVATHLRRFGDHVEWTDPPL